MALLGDDGRGFDLARRLEASGVWRTWLGDSIYLSFNHYLSSPSSWETFMRVDETKSRAQIQLQLRVRALLFDKATASLFLRSNSISDVFSVAVSKLNHNYLQLHGDDVYYTLENASPEGGFQRDGGIRQNQSLTKVTSSWLSNALWIFEHCLVQYSINTVRAILSLSKPSFNSGRRGSESDFSNLAQRSRYDELPDTWYTQFISRCGFKYGMSVGGQESDKRTPEGMSTYLRVTMFRMNCVPETALSPFARTQDDDVKTEFYGVLDTLPQVTTRSHVMMPEYLRMEERGVLRRKKAEKMGFSDEQAAQVSRKVVARMLLTMGFEGATEVPVDVFSQLVSRHICKLGRILKVLTDSYKKECSATQLIKMFLNTTGYSNLGGLAELVKDGTRMIHHPQNQKQPQVLQQQLHMQQQAPQRLPQQIQRQMHPQMQQMVNPQSLQQQQLLERMRKRQVTSPRPNMDMEKDRPLVQVKLENPSEMGVDGNAFNPMNPRHQQQIHQQFRQQQQQIAALSNMQQQQQQPGYNQFRQLASMQIPQMQTPTTGTVRAQPVKVEGFEQLMGGDSSLKHETEDKLRSPPTK
ncbi:BnaC03g48800D [Brassica napus]|uniref:BnaC03g48800D protein n=1 Tax=Brassica napus TaxID=3708 RepID=A0A078FNW3_BRANA|nr:BnaC03g48800D [Brassica napus]